MMLDLAQNSPPNVKIPTPTIIVEKNKTNIYIYIYFFNKKYRTPPIKKKLTHIVYYKYQRRSLQIRVLTRNSSNSRVTSIKYFY